MFHKFIMLSMSGPLRVPRQPNVGPNLCTGYSFATLFLMAMHSFIVNINAQLDMLIMSRRHTLCMSGPCYTQTYLMYVWASIIYRHMYNQHTIY